MFRSLVMIALGAGMATFAHASPNKIDRIGVIAPLTGEFARYGERIRKGVLDAGFPSDQLVFEDEGCDPKMAINAVTSLIAMKNVHLFIGPYCGSPQILAATKIKSDGGLAILGSSAPERVYESSGGRMFGMQYSIEEESTFNANAIDRLGIKSVVMVFDENDFARTHEHAFRAAYKGTILDTLVQSASDTSVMKSFALRIKQLGPEALYVPDAFPLLLGFLKELDNVGLGCLPVFSVYSAQSPEVVAASKGSAGSLIYSYPDIGPNDAVEHFSHMAASLLKEWHARCETIDCMVEAAKRDPRFGKSGTMTGAIVLRTARNGEFVPLDSATEQRIRVGGGVCPQSTLMPQ